MANEAASTSLILQQYMVCSCNLPQRILKEYKYKCHCKIKNNYELYINVWLSLHAPCRHRNAVVQLHSFLTLALDRGVSFTLYLCTNRSPHLLNRRLGGPQSWSGRFGEEKNLLPLPGIEPHITQSLHLLHYPSSQ